MFDIEIRERCSTSPDYIGHPRFLGRGSWDVFTVMNRQTPTEVESLLETEISWNMITALLTIFRLNTTSSFCIYRQPLDNNVFIAFYRYWIKYGLSFGMFPRFFSSELCGVECVSAGKLSQSSPVHVSLSFLFISWHTEGKCYSCLQLFNHFVTTSRHRNRNGCWCNFVWKDFQKLFCYLSEEKTKTDEWMSWTRWAANLPSVTSQVRN